MHKLIAELQRLYLPAAGWSGAELERHLRGEHTLALDPGGGAGTTRVLRLAFAPLAVADPAAHWSQLCAVANALQGELGLPAPAVSISGAHSFGLWLSLATPVPLAQGWEFLQRLVAAYCPQLKLAPDAVSGALELPPCLHRASGQWAAFIHPGMGAAFAEEAGLDMMPPLAGQVAFLEGLRSISAPQWVQALDQLDQLDQLGRQPAGAVVPPAPGAAPAGLLLRDATLEDIVRHLHGLHIEPTFRHRLPR